MNIPCEINIILAQKLIDEQFPEYKSLVIAEIEKQGHDNRSYKLGDDMLIRLPTAESYALKVPKEQELLPQLAKHLSIPIPSPIKMGSPSQLYPYPFSIYTWLPGKSINLTTLSDWEKQLLAYDLANFLKELQAITNVSGPQPGQHNWWRGDHPSVYDKGMREQAAALIQIIEINKALALWDDACATSWHKKPVWLHGDIAVGNILVDNGKLAAVIDFGGTALGDPACDLVIAWTYLSGDARTIFINEMNIDEATWLRAKAWALWKATFELSRIIALDSVDINIQKKSLLTIIESILE